VRNRRRVVYYAILLLLILGELLGERNYIIIIFPEYDIGHLLILGVNSLLHVIRVGFQLYSQLKKNLHNGTGVLGSSAVLTASQTTRLGKSSSITTRDEHIF